MFKYFPQQDRSCQMGWCDYQHEAPLEPQVQDLWGLVTIGTAVILALVSLLWLI